MKLNFHKYEGVGNDFILIDGRSMEHDLPGETIRIMCDRHRGIGADGLMVLTSEEGYDFRTRYYSADGAEIDICGNGGRCVVLFAEHLGIGSEEKYFSGRDGAHRAQIITMSENGDNALIEMGIIDVDSFEYSDRSFYLNTGVPHYVEFVDDVAMADVVGRGREIRYCERFRAGGGANANFVEIAGPGYIKVRTYERGVEDETQACGTGVVAAAIAAHLYAQNEMTSFTVNVPGGELDVSFSVRDKQHFYDISLTGPVRRVFEGTIRTGKMV